MADNLCFLILQYRFIPRKAEWVCFKLGTFLQSSCTVEPDFLHSPCPLGRMPFDPAKRKEQVDAFFYWRYY